ncbi:MAG: ParB/RepB/Spo0J family partition protein, partial [Brachybacterium sp.]
MTQKRGLGRGLGALIPGAGSTSAPEQELRTRTRPADETEGRSGSTRPVDMFFSGERVDADGRPQRGRADALDLATGMARAAAERRGRTASSTRAAAASGSKAPATETAEEEPTTRSA